jgi:hypothetical protein
MRTMERRPPLSLARACDCPAQVVEVPIHENGTIGAPLRVTHERIFAAVAPELLAKLEGPMRR